MDRVDCPKVEDDTKGIVACGARGGFIGQGQEVIEEGFPAASVEGREEEGKSLGDFILNVGRVGGCTFGAVHLTEIRHQSIPDIAQGLKVDDPSLGSTIDHFQRKMPYNLRMLRGLGEEGEADLPS